MRFPEIARYPLQGGTKNIQDTKSHFSPQIQDFIIIIIINADIFHQMRNISITLHSEPSQGINSPMMEIAWPPNLEMYKFAARNTYSLLREIHIHRCGNCPKLDKEGVTKGPGLDLIRWSSIRVNSNKVHVISSIFVQIMISKHSAFSCLR